MARGIFRWSSLVVLFSFSAFVLGACDSDVGGPNRAPVAVVGPDAEAALGSSVTLDGSVSYDPDGDALTYAWQVVSRPANSTAEPLDAGSRQTSMQVDVSGIYLVALVVSDGQADSGRDVMQIRAAGCESDAECEDEFFCTVNHRCEGGMCLSDAMNCAAAGDDCNEGICDEDENACGKQAFSDGTACENDDLFCTGIETCLAGVCTSEGNPCDPPESCDDVADTCSSAGCGDGEVTGLEQCDPGLLQNDNCCDATTCTWIALGEVDPQAVCAGAPECQVDVCDGGGGCTTVVMDDGADCGDDTDRLCDEPDTCLAGECEANLAGLGTPCRDASGVCDAAEFCDGVTVDCPEDLPAVDGTICDSDGFFCTGVETCQLGVCESPGNPCAVEADCDEENNMCGDCGDGFVGTDEVCDPGPPQNDNCCNVADCSWTGSGEVDPQGSCSGASDCRVDVCDGGGGCTEAFAGAGTNCGDAATQCSGQDTCDAVGGCLPNDFDSTTTCDDVGTDCVNQDYCDGSGGCTDNGFRAEGDSCGDAATQCSDQDTCDAVGACLPNDFDNTTTCDDDGDDCVNQDRCDGSGGCTDNGFWAEGDSCGDAETVCSGQDTCDAAGGCLPNHFDNTTNCGDDEAECVNQDTCDGSGGCTDNGYWVPGTPCAGDAYACTDDTCQGGACISVANDGNCTSPDLCVPVCSPDASGCVTPPGSLALGCEDPIFLDVDTVSDCSITLAGGGDITDQEACLSCSASVGVTTLIMTDFEDDLNPGSCAPVVDQVADGWTIVPGTRCYGDGTTCPMSDPDNRDCCDNLICPIDLAGTIAFQADRDTCTAGDRQWRLQHTFDTTGLANLELCFDYADRQAGGGNDVLQVDVSDSTGSYQAAVFCDVDGPRAGLEDVWFRTCVDLSGAASFVNDNQAVSVIFFVNSNDGNNRIYIDNISLRGETTACPAARVAVITEDFSGCSDPLVSWNGWTVGGGASINCSASFNCYDGSERAWVDNTSGATGELYQYLDMFAYSDIELCFYYGEDGANGGEILTVDVDSGSGWQPVWSKEGEFGPNNTCARFCLNLSDLDSATDHNANLGIRFRMQAGDKEIDLDQITLTAHQDCSAPALVSLSNPQDPESDGSYDFTATDSDGHLSADITCQWDPDATLSDWSHVWYRPAGINPTNVDPDLLCINPNSLDITVPAVIDTDAGTISGVGPADIRFFVVPQGGGAPDLGVFAFDNIDIAADVSVNGSRALVLLACNDLTVSADISATGTDGVMNTNGTCLSGTGGAGGSDGGSCPLENGLGLGGGGAGGDAGCNSYIDSGGAGGSFGGTGGAGGDGNDFGGCSIAGPSGAAPYADDTLSPLFGGSGGGAGGDDTGGPGGGGGGAVQLSAGGEMHIVSTARILVSGGAGAGGHDGGDSSPGGGGGSGGTVLLEAFSVTVDGVLAANGGGGGAGYEDDDGWGSGVAADGQPGTFDSTRAAGGQGSGIGGSGGEGSGGAFGDGGPGETNENGGGGGGAAGRIRINTFSGSATVSGGISPDSSNGYTQGTIVTW